MKRIFLLILLLLVGIVAALAAWYYWRFQYFPECAVVPDLEKTKIEPLKPIPEDLSRFIESKAYSSCAGGDKSFFEWYFMNIHYDPYWVELAFTFQTKGEGLAFAGLKINDSRSLKTLSLDTEQAKDLTWDDDNLGFSMLTRSHTDSWEKSFLRFHDSGDHSGQFEVRVVTRKYEFHAYLDPVSPGVASHPMCKDPAKPGYWYSASVLDFMGKSEGTFIDATAKSKQSYSFPAGGEAARGYLEHAWGNSDPGRLSWDWGEFGNLKNEDSLFVFQCNLDDEKILGQTFVTSHGKMPLIFEQAPPDRFSRVSFSRFFLKDGMYYPQQFQSFAVSEEGWAFLTGFSYGRNRHYTGFRTFGISQWSAGELDWENSPVNSVFDSIRGEPVSNINPWPPSDIALQCTEGCSISWHVKPYSSFKTEYWIYKMDTGQLPRVWAPKGIVSPELKERKSGSTMQLNFEDPSGTTESIYKILPVYIPPDLIHKRMQAGYPKLAGIDPDARVIEKEVSKAPEESAGNSRIRHYPFAKALKNDVLGRETILDTNESSKGLAFYLSGPSSVTLAPLFAPGVLIQSFDSMALDNGAVALAWSECSPIAGSSENTDFDVFLSFSNPENRYFRVFPVSMSEGESKDVLVDKQGDFVAASWTECESTDKCRRMEKLFPVIEP